MFPHSVFFDSMLRGPLPSSPQHFCSSNLVGSVNTSLYITFVGRICITWNLCVSHRAGAIEALDEKIRLDEGSLSAKSSEVDEGTHCVAWRSGKR